MNRLKPIFLITITSAGLLSAGGYSGGLGSEASPYQIDNVYDLKELVQTPADWNMVFSQTDHINANVTAWWDDADDNSDGDKYNDPNDETSAGDNNGFPGIGTSGTWFTGTYDGNNYTIDGIVMNRASTDNVGFFTRVQNAEIDDIDFTDLAITGGNYVGGVIGEQYGSSSTINNCSTNGDVTGGNHVGGIVGYNRYGTIKNCSNDATLEGSGDYVGGVAGRHTESAALIENCSNTASVTGTANRVGGIVGQTANSSTITDCSNTGAVSGVIEVGGVVGLNAYNSTLTTSYNTGSISGSGDRVGGVAGYNWNGSSISNSYSTGSVTGTGTNRIGGLVGVNALSSAAISNCYSTGSVSGSTQAAGLIYTNNDATVTACFWNTQTSGQATSPGGGTGKTTSEMKDYTTFTDAGWDFVSESANGSDNYWDADQAGTVNSGYPILAWQQGADTSLPVTLLSFEAIPNPSGSITLTWTTASETENLGFILERRSSAHPETEWKTIASLETRPELQGQGSASTRSVYTYLDDSVLPDEHYDYRLADVDYSGVKTVHGLRVLGVESSVGPSSFKLLSAYPNPFNPVTTIRYQLPVESEVQLMISDIAGRSVQTLQVGWQAPGSHELFWQGLDDTGHSVSAGIYLVRLQAADEVRMTRITLLK